MSSFGKCGVKPIMRLSALPLTKVPDTCAKVKLNSAPTWDSVSDVQRQPGTSSVLTLDTDVMAWGTEQDLSDAFGSEFVSIEEMSFNPDWRQSSKLHVKKFLEDGLGKAFARARPLLIRRRGSAVYLIADSKTQDVGIFQKLFDEVGKTTGLVSGLAIPETDTHPRVDKVHFAEALRVSLGYGDDRLWLLLRPDVWIWPAYARQHATKFLDNRKRDRRNDKHDRLLSAWVGILSDGAGKDVEVTLSPFDGETGFVNPVFGFSTQTGFAMKRGMQ